MMGKTVPDLMGNSPCELHRHDSLTVADQVMREPGFRQLPVLDEKGHLCGVVSERDLFRGTLPGALGYGGRAESRMLQSIRVKEVMHRNPHSIAPDERVATAATMVRERNVGSLPVVDGRGG